MIMMKIGLVLKKRSWVSIDILVTNFAFILIMIDTIVIDKNERCRKEVKIVWCNKYIQRGRKEMDGVIEREAIVVPTLLNSSGKLSWYEYYNSRIRAQGLTF